MDSITLGFFDILSCIVCLVIGIHLWLKKKNSLPQLFLSLMLITYALELFIIGIIKIGLISFESSYVLYPIHFTAAHIVLLFLYFKTLFNPENIKKYYWLIGLAVIDWLTFLVLAIIKVQFPPEVAKQVLLIYSSLIFITFFLLSIYMLFKIIGIPADSRIRKSGPIKSQIQLLSYLCVYYIVYTSVVVITNGGTGVEYAAFSIMNSTFAIVLATLAMHSYIKYHKENEQDIVLVPADFNQVSEELKNETTIPFKTNIPFEKSPITEPTKSSITFDKIRTKIVEEQLYLDKNLTLAKLSESLRINGRRISETISQETGENLKTFINNLRVDHSVKLLLDEENVVLTIKAIAEASGFKSISVFYSSFKETTGFTPNEIRGKNDKS